MGFLYMNGKWKGGTKRRIIRIMLIVSILVINTLWRPFNYGNMGEAISFGNLVSLLLLWFFIWMGKPGKGF